MKAIFSIEKPRAFVRDFASRGDECDIEAANVEVTWDFENMMTVDELPAFGVRRKLTEIQQICKDKGESVPTSLIEVIDLS